MRRIPVIHLLPMSTPGHAPILVASRSTAFMKQFSIPHVKSMLHSLCGLRTYGDVVVLQQYGPCPCAGKMSMQRWHVVVCGSLWSSARACRVCSILSSRGAQWSVWYFVLCAVSCPIVRAIACVACHAESYSWCCILYHGLCTSLLHV